MRLFLAVAVAVATLTASFPLLDSPARAGASAASTSPTLASLTRNQKLAGFTTLCVYTGDGGMPIGARFRHDHTGYIFDYLQMDSVPQAYIYVNTPPTSDKGEPHTQEHLLLGKGNKGRAVASAETLTMSSSSAYTEQWRTCFFFNTTAGADVFFGQLRMRLDALLHPDYTDEEVRREVRNFGVTENSDGTLRLEEKGSVYNEMVSTMDKSGSQLYRAMGSDIYGPEHPLSYESGGTPEALRTLTPDQIKTFRTRDYYLGNMGMVASFSSKLPMTSVLARVDRVLTDLQPEAVRPGQPPTVEPHFPPAHPRESRDIQIVAFPDQNAAQPGDVGLAWPADRKLDLTDYELAQLFFENVASDAETPLYKRFIDAKTRTLETGATGVYAYISDDEGQPVYVGLSDVKPASLNAVGIERIRSAVLAEFATIAGWPDGSPELLSFNARLRTRLQASRRATSKFVNSPPGFGARFSSSAWMDQCRLLEQAPGFRKSVLMTPEMDAVERRLSGKTNLWRGLLAAWKITGVTPYAVGTIASPALVARQARERGERSLAEVARLRRQYGLTDDQATIRRYKSDYDAETARQNQIAARAKTEGQFLAHPPLTLDDDLIYRVTPGPLPIFTATFDTMTSATVRLNLRIPGQNDDSNLIYIALLPTLIDSVGVILNGKPLSYEETLEKQRQEILSVGANFDTNPDRGRYELQISGSGNNLAESKRAVEWMHALLMSPNWRVDNLPRIRDVIDQSLQAERNRMLEQEEFWVRGVDGAWRYQRSPLALATGCFLTRAHFLQRLRWMLKSAPGAADHDAFLAFLATLADVAKPGVTRSDLDGVIKSLAPFGPATATTENAARRAIDDLPASTKPLANDAIADLSATLTTLPDDTLAADWRELCSEMAADFAQGPEQTLKRLELARRSLLSKDGARLTIVGSSSTIKALGPSINSLTSLLTAPTAVSEVSAPADSPGRITARLRQRAPGAAPVFVALVAPSMKGGVVMNEASSTSYRSTDRESLLRLLAGNLYGGGGADSVFMKTWGAGLAYGNGIGNSLADGSVLYYADHTPEIPQTVRFVIGAVKASTPKPDLVEYALANTFSSRTDGGYEARAFAMADNLADGITPSVVRDFRTRLLALRTAPGLVADVYRHLPAVMAAILPGYAGSGVAPATGAHYVAIGPEKQLTAYESYLKTVEGSDTTLYRLYPRDFWVTW